MTRPGKQCFGAASGDVLCNTGKPSAGVVV